MDPQPPPEDPFRAVWQMSSVGDAGKHGDRSIRWVAGIVGTLVGFVPFAVVVGAVWGLFGDSPEVTSGGVAILVVGVALSLCLGGWLATNRE